MIARGLGFAIGGKGFARGHHPRAACGFGAVEFLVVLVIGFVASVAIFQTRIAFDERRAILADPGAAGAQALARVENLLVNAGFGLAAYGDTKPGAAARGSDPHAASPRFAVGPWREPSPHLGCTARVAGTAVLIAPLAAASGVDRGGRAMRSDVLTVIAGSSASLPLPVRAEPVVAGSRSIALASALGFLPGDWLIVYGQEDPRATRPPGALGRPCTLARIVGIEVTAAGGARLGLDAPIDVDLARASVIDLGASPVLARVSVNGRSQLVVENLLDPTEGSRVLAEPIAAMKVQLGLDLGGDDVVDEWIAPPRVGSAGSDPAEPRGAVAAIGSPVEGVLQGGHPVLAVRIGLLAGGGSADATGRVAPCGDAAAAGLEVLPAIAGDAEHGLAPMPGSGPVGLAAGQPCIAYRAVSAVVPLRNALRNIR